MCSEKNFRQFATSCRIFYYYYFWAIELNALSYTRIYTKFRIWFRLGWVTSVHWLLKFYYFMSSPSRSQGISKHVISRHPRQLINKPILIVCQISKTNLSSRYGVRTSYTTDSKLIHISNTEIRHTWRALVDKVYRPKANIYSDAV